LCYYPYLLGYIQKWGGSNILYLSKEGLAKIAEKVNRFFYSSELKQEKGELVDIQHVLSQPLWLNPLIKIGGNMCMNKICCENGVFFVNDLISETILQRESQNSSVYEQTKSVNNRKTVKTVMTLTWYRHF
jgi:hypothetical protein